MTGGEALLRAVLAEGIDRVFGLTGGKLVRSCAPSGHAAGAVLSARGTKVARR